MRILFATTNTYLPQRVGGTESSMHALALGLLKRNIHIAVLSGLSPSGWIGITNRLKRRLSNIDAPCDYKLGYPVYRTWDCIANIPEVAQNFRPNIVVLQGGQIFRLADPFVKLGIPTIAAIRHVDFAGLGGIPCAFNLSGYIANSYFTATRFKDVFGLHATVIYNIFDKNQYTVKNKGKYVTFINPIVEKGVDIAFALAQKNPSIPFLFVEAWPLRKAVRLELMQKAQALGNIKWHYPTLDMRTIYRKTRILLVPSQVEEAWGRIVSEAQISGIPVLVSNRGGLPEAVGSGGLIIPHDDLENWQENLWRVWGDDSLWCKLSSRAKLHSDRPELQVDYIMDQFIATVRRFSGLE